MIDISATNRGAKRSPSDFYATPRTCVESIVKVVDWGYAPRILEPCRGDGAIMDVLHDHGLHDVDWCEIQLGRNFLTYEPVGRYDFVLTNPPYSLAQQFIEHSLTMADTVIMLLRLNYLGAQCRRNWWPNRKPNDIYVLPERPKFTTNKHGKLATDATEYGWFRWNVDEEYTGTRLHWL